MYVCIIIITNRMYNIQTKNYTLMYQIEYVFASCETYADHASVALSTSARFTRTLSTLNALSWLISLAMNSFLRRYRPCLSVCMKTFFWAGSSWSNSISKVWLLPNWISRHLAVSGEWHEGSRINICRERERERCRNRNVEAEIEREIEKHTHTHTHTHRYIYIYRERERWEREREREKCRT